MLKSTGDVKFETRTVDGKIGIFFSGDDEDRDNLRKFGYKNKELRHPIRAGTKAEKPQNPKPETKAPGKNIKTKAAANPGATTITLTREQLNELLTAVAEDTLLTAKGELSQEEEKKEKSPREEKPEEVKPKENIDPPKAPETAQKTETPLAEQTNDRYQPNPHATLSLAEKKRLQWEKERVEKESAWNPFGRPGAGAPTRTDGLRVKPEDSNQQVPQSYQNQNRPPERAAAQVTAPAPAPAPKPEIYYNPAMDRDQSKIPVAMRTSVAFGDTSTDWIAKNKEDEKRRWIEDLERQRDEQRRRKESDKDDGSTTAHHANKPPPSIQPTPDVDSTHMRGQNWLVDPAQREENERRRKKMVEQQQAIQEQVQEKQRQKQLEKEMRDKEEREREERFTRERAKIQEEVEQEKLKVKLKQENELKRAEMLKKTLEEATEQARAEKRKKLARHTSQGDDEPEPPKVHESKTPRGQEAKTPRGQEPKPANAQESKPYLPPSYTRQPEPLPPQKNVDPETSVYTERILTPSSHRVRDATSAWSTQTVCREFGTQTETDVAKILNRVYKPASADSGTRSQKGDPKSNQRPNPNPKVREERHVAWKEKTPPLSKGKAAPAERDQKPPIPRKTRGNPPKKVLKQSERDPFYAQKKRDGDERRARRQEELRHLQEINDNKLAQHRTKSRARSVPAAREEAGRKPQKSTLSHAESVNHLPGKPAIRSKSPPVPAVQKHPSTLQAKKFEDNEVIQRDDLADTIGADLDHTMRRRLMGEVSPSLAHVFVPMVRTKEVLDPAQACEPLPPSREATAVRDDRERARQNYFHSQEPHVYGTQVQNLVDKSDDIPLRTSTYYYPDSFRGSHDKDPLYNPRLVKDTPTMRQSHILQQLNILKQSLIMKQREFASSQALS